MLYQIWTHPVTQGVTPDTAGVSEDGFTFNDVLGMLILDIIIYSALAWYLGNVSVCGSVASDPIYIYIYGAS